MNPTDSHPREVPTPLVPATSPAFMDTLRDTVGASNVLVEGDLSAWEQDWRQRSRGKALAVVRPATTREVAEVVKTCLKHHVPVVCQGGNTGLVDGSIPDATGQELVLSLGRMNAVRAIDALNATMTVDAGCILQVVQEAAAAEGMLFPLTLGSQGTCTIGGNLATNAGGTQVVRYGNARELCLGLEVVTPDGEIWDGLTGLRKDNTGYDLQDLFVGSEGTLGVITAATLKLYPQPRSTITAWLAFPSLEAAASVLQQARAELSSGLTAFEIMGSSALALVERHQSQVRIPLSKGCPYFALLERSDHEPQDSARSAMERLLESALASSLITDAVVADNLEQARSMWAVRESIALVQSMEGVHAKHDISLPISAIGDFCAETDQRLTHTFPGSRLVNFGHMGDGNLHYNVHSPDGSDAATFVRSHEHDINAIVYGQVKKYRGSISAEHGIGRLKVGDLPHYKSATDLRLMGAIKAAIDPLGLFNPGRVLMKPHS